MLIEQLSEYSVKFTMANMELAEYGLNFDTIEPNSANTRLMLSHLIALAENQEGVNIDFKTSEVYVEVFPCSGGCIVYLSLMQNDRPRKATEHSDFIVCATDSLNHLTRVSKQLVRFSANAILSSRLYLKDGVFLLLIDLKKQYFERVLFSVVEFCEYSTKRSSIREPYQILADYDAIYRLSVLN